MHFLNFETEHSWLLKINELPTFKSWHFIVENHVVLTIQMDQEAKIEISMEKDTLSISFISAKASKTERFLVLCGQI
jgi:hypothetical protein